MYARIYTIFICDRCKNCNKYNINDKSYKQ